MNFKWRNESLQEIVKYNQYLLLAVIILSVLSLILAIAIVSREDKWVIIPSDNIENRMEVSSNKLYPSYLKSWAYSIARSVFTASPEDVVTQHAQVRIISSSNKKLDSFFEKQLAFIKGNHTSSVFYAKEAKLVDKGVLVYGTLHYWFAGSDQKIALEKGYLISYKQGNKGLVFLTNIEEVSSTDTEEKD